MDFLIKLAMLLGLGKLLGDLCEKINIPSTIGYMSAGMALGPVMLNLVRPGDISDFAELGAIMLLFVAGYGEVNFSELLGGGKKIFAMSLLGYLVPFAGVAAVGYAMGFGTPEILVAAIAASATYVVTSARSLIKMGKLRSNVGNILMSSSVLDNVIALAAFTWLVAFFRFGDVGIPEAINVLIDIAAFAAMFLAADRVLPRIISMSRTMRVEEAHFTVGFVIILFISFLGNRLGFHGIVGAFIAGMLLSNTRAMSRDFSERLTSISYGVFVPIFFGWTGLMFNVTEIHPFIFALVVVAIGLDAATAYATARLARLPAYEAKALAYGTIPRGGICVVIASISKQLGILSGQTGDVVFASIIILTIVSTFITPKLFEGALSDKRIN